ncbi:MAG: hypothetical protein IJV89_09615 [Lentisphaeria bacterium]|nr:hypothetical protein [Lentisphaeria bacterium]
MRRREIIFTLLLAAVFLLAAGFFFFSSSFFLTGVVVPWISRSTGCPMSVENAEFRPLTRRLILHGFRLGREDQPFLTVRRARGTAQFRNLVRGIIDFDDVELHGAELNICRDASGRWCSYELGTVEHAPSSVPKPAAVSAEKTEKRESPSSSPVQVRVARCRMEDSRVNVIVRDRQRDFSWSFTRISGEMDDFRNNGTMMIKCFSPFQVTGHEGIDFSGKVEWNGELVLDEELAFAGLRGGFVFGSFDGRIDQRKIGGSEVRCTLDVLREKDRKWNFRNFRLIQQENQQVGSWVEFAGYMPDGHGKYRLDFRRFLLSGQLLTLLMDMGCGVRPGNARFDAHGSVSGDFEQITANIVCRAERKAGPAWFGTEKVDLPDFQLQGEQNMAFDIHSRKAEVRNAHAQIFSGGRQILSLHKFPKDNSVKALINGFDLKLLQFFIPDTQKFGIADGVLNGKMDMRSGDRTGSVLCRTDLHFSETTFRAGAWQPEKVDAVVAGNVSIPLDLSKADVSYCRITTSRDQDAFLTVSVSGSVPIRQENADLFWQASGNLERILSWSRCPSARDAAKISGVFAPVRMEASGKLKFSSGRVSFLDHQVRLSGKKQSSLNMSLTPRDYQWLCPAKGTWSIRWQSSFPADLLPAMPWAAFSGGRYAGTGSVDIRNNGGEFVVQGAAEGQELSGALYGKSFSRLSVGADFSFLRNRQGEYNLNRSLFYCRAGGQPALRLESSGSGTPAGGAFHADVQVRYLNEHLLNIFFPGRFRSGQLAGRSRISGNFRNMNWDLNGFFTVNALRSPGASRAVDGKLQYEFKRRGNAGEIPRCRLLLNSGGKVLADLQLTAAMPDNPSLPMKVRLAATTADLSSLYEQISSPAPAVSGGTAASGSEAAEYHAVDRVAPAAPDRMVLQTGPRAKEVDLDLRDMSWGSSQKFALSGKLFLLRNKVVARNLIVDGGDGRILWNVDGMDFPTGMILAVHGKVLKPIAIGPFVTLFFPSSGLNGVLESGEWNFNFRRLFSAHWGEDLAGQCRLNFREVDFPVNAANGPLSRLLLLPVETIVRADQLIPSNWNVRQHFETLWKYKLSAESPFARLRFHSGELLVAAENGELQIKRMLFTGDPLSRMSVEGKMRLMAPYELEFDSQVILCGVQAKLPVRGVVSSPHVAAWQVFARMPGQTLSGWLDIFSPFSDSNSASEIPLISPFIRLLRDVAGFQE